MDRRPPSRSRPARRAWAVALTVGGLCAWSVCLWSAPAWAQADPAGKLHDVERKIQSQKQESERLKARAVALKAELDAVTAQLVAAAGRAHDQEAQVLELEAELNRLETEARGKEHQLRTRRQQFSGVVMALTRIARFPTEALIVQPIPPQDTVRSAILLRAAVPAIESRASALNGELKALRAARTDVERRRAELQGALERLRAEEAGIEAIRKQKAALRAEAVSQSRAAQTKAETLAREAKDLRELMERLEGARKKAEAEAAAEAQGKARAKAETVAPTKPSAAADGGGEETPAPDLKDVENLGRMGSIVQARGRLPFPAVGRLTGLYGQPLEGGLTRKGLSIETRDGANVIAPFDGKVVFAGPFRGYGQLLIIDHGEGYHSLLAGLGRIDAAMGQPVLAGEPVAVMDNGEGKPELYVEFRRDNQPINPLPWLASRKGTPKG